MEFVLGVLDLVDRGKVDKEDRVEQFGSVDDFGNVSELVEFFQKAQVDVSGLIGVVARLVVLIADLHNDN